MPPKVSIISVYFNTPEDLRKLHETMKQFLRHEDYEWIIADNASEINLSKEFAGALYLRMPSNLGFAAASNRAAERASGSCLFFVNPDCEFIEDCLPPMLHALETSVIVGPKVLNPDGTIQLSFGPYLSIGREAMQKFLSRFEKSKTIQRWISKKGSFKPDYVSGCALMIRTDAFRKAGGFDEHFFLYNEDVDLCRRVQSVQYVPSVRIIHARNRSVKLLPDRVRSEYRKSQMYFYRKHHGALQNFLLKLYLSASGKLPS